MKKYLHLSILFVFINAYVIAQCNPDTTTGLIAKWDTSAQYRPNITFNISAGIMLDPPANVFSQIRQPDIAKSLDDYNKKSRRQKNVGWILLGTGIALISSGIAIAYHQDDALTGIAAFVYISGPGIISSLASIPFFIASGHNKRKAMNL